MIIVFQKISSCVSANFHFLIPFEKTKPQRSEKKHDQKPRRKNSAYDKDTYQSSDNESHRYAKDIYDFYFFEKEGIYDRIDEIQEKTAKDDYSSEQIGEIEHRQSYRYRSHKSEYRIQHSACKRPMFLFGMVSIFFFVFIIIDDIGSSYKKRKHEENDDTFLDSHRIEHHTGKHQRDEDDDIFHPLFRPQRKEEIIQLLIHV